MTINKVHQCKDNSELKEMKQKDEILRVFLMKISAYKWKLFNISFVCFCFFRKDRSVVYMDTHTEKKNKHRAYSEHKPI